MGRQDRSDEDARTINEQPWQPPAGMSKRRCEACAFWFASREGATLCPDCAIRRQRRREL